MRLRAITPFRSLRSAVSDLEGVHVRQELRDWYDAGGSMVAIIYDELEHLRRAHPAWRLLRSDHAALVLIFRGRVFVDVGAGDISARSTARPVRPRSTRASRSRRRYLSAMRWTHGRADHGARHPEPVRYP